MSKSKKIAVDQFLQGHVLDVLRTLPDGCVQCCVTSPPYWGLRVYSGEQEQIWLDGNSPCQEHVWEDDVYLSPQSGGTGEASAYRNPKYLSAGVRHVSKSNFCTVCGAWRGGLGLEPTIDLYVQHIVEVFHEVKRAMRDDGVCFINLGDSYSGSGKGLHGDGKSHGTEGAIQKTNYGSVGVPRVPSCGTFDTIPPSCPLRDSIWNHPCDGCQAASVLRSLRNSRVASPKSGDDSHAPNQEHKESVPDHLATKDCEAPKEPLLSSVANQGPMPLEPHDGTTETLYPPGSAGRRMSLARQAARERGGEYEHNTETLGFRPSCSCEDKTGTGRCLVLDPFMGSGTVACVAARYGRSFVGIDVAYQEMARRRIARVQPLLPIVNPSTVLGEQ